MGRSASHLPSEKHPLRKSGALLLSLLFALPAVPPRSAALEDWKSESESGGILVENVNVQTTGKFTKVIIQSSAPLKYRDIYQATPPGLFLYMSADTLSKRPAIQQVYGELLEDVRFGYKGGLSSPTDKALPLDYILLKLGENAKYKISQKEWILVIELSPSGGRTPASARPSPASAAHSYDYTPYVAPQRGKQLAVLPSQPQLQDFLDVGLSNYAALQIAEKEHRLAKLRFVEASRALFPSITGRYEQSKGRMLLDPTDPEDDTDFRRKEYGVQIGQPIFQSGRLYYSLRQASMQKRMSEQSVRKTKAEAAFEIKKAYYNLLKAKHALADRKDLAARAEKVVELTRKKKQLEVVTEAELLGVESQASQINYRMLSDDKDLLIARLRMEALLNSPDPLPDIIPEPDEPFNPRRLAELNIPVESLVDQALQNRPDALSADYSARFQRYAEKVAKADGRLRFDVSGFVGKSGGAFETEDLQLRSSWNVGLQASTYFGGNSIKGTGMAEKTSPDLGETSRTQTRAQTANIGLFDGIKVISDRRQAAINKERALMEQEQTRRSTEVDVREAYYNLEKAKLQLKGAQIEVNYREKDAIIARQKEKMNLIEPSQALAAESSHTEARVGLEEAIAFYHISLASLEKAVGLPLESLVDLP